MNLPNVLTLSRIPMMFVIVELLYTHERWPEAHLVGAATATLVLYIISGITDFLDGYLARKRGQVSNFGRLMDAVTDKVLLLGIMIALVDLERIPVELVLLILGREFLITGIRLVAASKGVVVSAEKAGKQKTVTQIIAVGAFLLADVVHFDLGSDASVGGVTLWAWLNYFGLGVFILATFFTLSSGARYFRKYGALVFAE